MQKKTKYIIITGGVISGLGKGIVATSIAAILPKGKKVIPIKCDGYLNVDPGTMNPIEHGEVFVLEDGGEVDMDFGHYERFINIDCKIAWNLTSGKIYSSILERERRGEYLGQTVQLIPHGTNEIKDRFKKIVKEEKPDIVLIEIGGTVGDIENELYIEAVRQLKRDVGENNILFVHLTLVPKLSVVGEQKTKPTQQSVKLLEARGIAPDIIIGRAQDMLEEKIISKISLFTGIEKEAVVSSPDLEIVYELPILFKKQNLHKVIAKKLRLREFDTKINGWERLISRMRNPKQEINIALCGKYTDLHDSYASIIESLKHAGAKNLCKVNISQIETTDIEKGKSTMKSIMKDTDAVIVPGGFGSRGIEGKIKVIRYCRENNIPLLGLCYGFQLTCIEFARNVCMLKDANTTEADTNTSHPIIHILEEQKNIKDKGATMRLGSWPAILKKGTKTYNLYKKENISERHRHRYEVNQKYIKILESNGLRFSGKSPDGTLMEFLEIINHPFLLGTQGHPELKSRPMKPHPLFDGLVKASIRYKNTRTRKTPK